MTSFIPVATIASIANGQYAPANAPYTPPSGYTPISTLSSANITNNPSVNITVPIAGTGMIANVYQNGNQYVIAFQGTNPLNTKQLYDDQLILNGISGANNPGLNAALAYVQAVQKAISDQNPNAVFTLTGHSLGGAEADYVLEQLGSNSNTTAVTFDAPALASTTIGLGALNVDAINIASTADPATNSTLAKGYQLPGSNVFISTGVDPQGIINLMQASANIPTPLFFAWGPTSYAADSLMGSAHAMVNTQNAINTLVANSGNSGMTADQITNNENLTPLSTLIQSNTAANQNMQVINGLNKYLLTYGLGGSTTSIDQTLQSYLSNLSLNGAQIITNAEGFLISLANGCAFGVNSNGTTSSLTTTVSSLGVTTLQSVSSDGSSSISTYNPNGEFTINQNDGSGNTLTSQSTYDTTSSSLINNVVTTATTSASPITDIFGQAVATSIANGTITIADTSNVTLNGASNGITVGNSVTLTAIGDNNTFSGPAGGSDAFNVSGNNENFNVDNSIINIALTGCTDGIHCQGDTINAAAADTINIDGDGQTGLADIVNMSNGTVDLSANANTSVVGSTDAITIASNDTVSDSGTVNTITASGGGDVITADNATISMTAQNAANAIIGEGDAITATISDTLSISGDSQPGAVDTVAMANGSLVLGTNANVSATGAGDTFTVSQNDTLSAVGGSEIINASGYDAITVNGANARITGDYSAISLTSTKSAYLIDGQGDTISAATSDILTISGDAGQTGVADILNISSGVVTVTSNADLTLTGTGTGNTITLSANDTFSSSTSGDKITATSAGDQITETGANAAISAVAGDFVTVDGTNAVINAANASVTVLGDQATINGANVNVTADPGAVVTATGLGDVIYANGSTITLTVANAAYTIDGLGDTIYGATGDTLTIIGNGQTAAVDSVEMNSGTIDLASNTNVDIIGGINSTHNIANLGLYDDLASTGYSDTISANGPGDWIQETGSYANISEVAGDTATIDNSTTINAPGATVDITNGSATINGDDATISQIGGSQITANGADDAITLTGRYNTDILNGVGDNLASDGNGFYDTITANSANEILALNGYGDTLTANGLNDSATLGLHPGTTTLTGADETVNSSGAGTVNSTGAYDVIDIAGAGASATVSGIGSSLTDSGAGDVGRLSGANETAIDTASAAGSTIISSGASNTILMNGLNDQSTETGAYDTIGSTAASTTIYAEGGFQNISLTGASDTIQSTAASANANITGSGANESIHSNGNNSVIASTGASTLTYDYGSNDTETQSGSGSKITDSGSANIDTMNGPSETGMASGANITINSSGTADTVRLNNPNDTTIDSGANATVTTYAAGDAVTVSGHSDAVTTYNETAATPDPVTFNGTGESLNGSYDSITFGSGASASITGSHDTVSISGNDAVTVSGTNDTFSGNATNTITFSGSTAGDIVSGGAISYDDPIIFAINGETIQTVGLAQSPASFDYAGTGQPIATGWVTPGEGLLVYQDPASTGAPTIIAGYNELDQIAGATSGNLDATNAAWSNLSLWVDPTGTAQFSPDQLHSLSDLGISSISLDPTADNINSNGNQITELGTYLYTTGVVGQAASVDLMFDQTPPKPAITIAAHA